MSEGWVKLYRKFFTSWIWRDKSARIVFLWLIGTVDRKTGKRKLGRKQGAQETLISESSFYRALKRLDSEQVTNSKRTTKFTEVSLKNWHIYQEANSKRTESGGKANTIQEKKRKELFKNNNGGNPIILDPTFKRLLTLDPTTDEGYRRKGVCLEKLEKDYPGYRYSEEWREANRLLNANG